LVNDFYWFDGEFVFAVLGEHGDDIIQNDMGFSNVGGGALNEDILGIESDFRVVAVDDGWK
jgi:hypothetical protein